MFFGDEISLVPTCGFFITMNPVHTITPHPTTPPPYHTTLLSLPCRHLILPRTLPYLYRILLLPKLPILT